MKKPFIIALTGTPCVGKTSAAKILKKKGFVVVSLNSEIKKRGLYSMYDRKRKTYVADMKKIELFLKNELKSENYKNKIVVIDSHISHLLPSRFIGVVIVLRCKPAVLEKRLKERGWNAEKVRENLEAEIIGLIEYEARKKHRKIFVSDTTGLNPENIAEKIIRILRKL